MKKSKDGIWIFLFLLPTIVIFLVFNLYPILAVLITGFTSWNGFNPPIFNGIENYIKLITYDDTFLKSIRNLTIWMVIASTVLVGFGVIVALVLEKKRKGWKIVRGTFMIPNVIALSAWAIMYRFMFNDNLGLLNNFIRKIGFGEFHVKWFFQTPAAFIAITLTWIFFAVYVTLIVLTDLMAIPEELYDVAEIEGASYWQQVWHIKFPLIKNAIGTSIILSVVSRIAMFEPIILTSRGGPGNDTYNIPLMLVDGIMNYEYGYANAAATMMIIFGVVVMLIISKTFAMNKD